MSHLFSSATEARRLPTPAGRSPWIDRLLLALALTVVAALLAGIALTVVNLLPSSGPAQQPVQTEMNVPAVPVVVPVEGVQSPPVQDVTGISVPTTPSIPSFSEQVNWEFMETEIHSLYKDTRPLFMREFIGWFRAQDGSVRPIAEFTGNSMSDEDKLGASIDGIVFVRDNHISIDGAKHWVRMYDFPFYDLPFAPDEGFPQGLLLRGAFREGDKISIYGGYDYLHKEAGISATNWYQIEVPAATLEGLSQ